MSDDPLFLLTIAASNLKVVAPDQYTALERAFQVLVEKENKAFLAAGPEGIMGAQGRTNMAILIRDRLVNCMDQRKNYEEAEANAIGTEYIRADLLPAEDAAKVRELLKSYVDQRIAFYNRDKTASASAEAARVRDEPWSTAARVASAQPNPVMGLGVSGMNDVFNTQAGTQAAWLNASRLRPGH